MNQKKMGILKAVFPIYFESSSSRKCQKKNLHMSPTGPRTRTTTTRSMWMSSLADPSAVAPLSTAIAMGIYPFFGKLLTIDYLFIILIIDVIIYDDLCCVDDYSIEYCAENIVIMKISMIILLLLLLLQ